MLLKNYVIEKMIYDICIPVNDVGIIVTHGLSPHTGPKVPHSRPAPKRKYGIFSLNVRKNSIRSTGVKLASPQLVFATLAFGSGVNSHELWTVQVSSFLGA